jgi:hypothetical protein
LSEVPLIAASTGILFGVLDKGEPLYAIAVVPEFIWELSLGVYLTVTGGRVAGLVEPEPARAMPATIGAR